MCWQGMSGHWSKFVFDWQVASPAKCGWDSKRREWEERDHMSDWLHLLSNNCELTVLLSVPGMTITQETTKNWANWYNCSDERSPVVLQNARHSSSSVGLKHSSAPSARPMIPAPRADDKVHGLNNGGINARNVCNHLKEADLHVDRPRGGLDLTAVWWRLTHSHTGCTSVLTGEPCFHH